MDQNSMSKTSASATEKQIKTLLESLSAELEREISTKECPQASSIASSKLNSKE